MRASRRQLIVGSSAATAAAAIGLPTIKVSRASAQEKTVVRWWHIQTNVDQAAAVQAKADAYVEANPDVEIEITILENEAFKTRLTTVLQAGDPPDMFQSWGGGVLYQYANAGLVRDITDDLAVDGWGDSFAQAALNLFATDGRNYGVPWKQGVVGFWYNKALFEQAGIEAPPVTWAELLETVSTLKAAGITPITVGGQDKWPAHFYWVYLATRYGGKAAFDAAYDRSGSFTDEPFIQAGQTLAELVALEPFQDGFLGATYPDSAANFGNGNAAIELMGQWHLQTQAGASESGEGIGEDLGFFPFPSVEGGAGDPSDVLGGADGYAFGVNATDAAVDFARFMTAVENQIELSTQGVAVLPTVAGSEVSIEDANLLQVTELLANANYFQLYYDQFLPPAVGGVVNDAVQGILAGTLSPEQAAQMVEDSAAAELAGM